MIEQRQRNDELYFKNDKLLRPTKDFDSTLVKFDSEKVVENIQGDTVTINPVKSVSIYEYEIAQNDKKRNIYVLKSKFLQTIIDDMEEIMSYGFSTQYVDIKTKKGGE